VPRPRFFGPQNPAPTDKYARLNRNAGWG